MKKLFALLLSAGMLLSMTGCSSEKVEDDALTAFVDGLNQMDKMESAFYEADMDMDVEGEKVNVGINGGYLEKDGKLNFSMLIDGEEGGTSIGNLIEIYYKDDHMFLQLLEDKYQVDMKELLDMISATDDTTSDTDTAQPAYKKEDIKKYLMKASKDGNKINLEFDSDQVQEALKDSIDEAEKTYGYDLEIKVKSTTGVAEIKDGFIVDAKITFDINMIVKDESNQSGAGDMQLVLGVKFDDINQNKELKFPDFSEYKETDFFDMISELMYMNDTDPANQDL